MNNSKELKTDPPTNLGSCLCGSVRFEISGAMSDIIFCHCTQCRKSTGNFVASVSVEKKYFNLIQDNKLKWYASSDEAERGFCSTCGSNLFWKPKQESYICVWAGSIDEPNDLKGEAHIYTAFAGNYYSIEDNLPQFEHDYPE